MHVFLQKSPLCRSHFFVWLKTENFSNACGTSTLKSPPSRGSDAPHVHLRLRKRLSRCTLDCGFQTPESPALRGFVGGLQALATAALYLVLKSNGLHRPKIRLKKFAFSPKPIPANIVKKLPSQRCSKPLFIALFIFSHKRPTFAFTGESGYTHSPFGERSHTAACTPKQGAFRMGVVSLLSERSARSPTSPGRVSERQTLPLLGLGRVCSRRTQKAYGTAMCLCASLSRRRRGPAGLRDPVVRPLMLRFSVSDREVSTQSPVNATRSSSHLNPSTTQPSSKNRTQRLTRRNVCALDVAILEVSCYTDGHRKPLKNFFIFFENRVRNGAARASI